MLNQVLKVFTGIRQQSVEVLDFDFHKVGQQHIAGEVEIFVMCTENFLTNHLVKEF